MGRLDSNVTCPWGYYGASCQNIALDCADANRNGQMNAERFVVTTIQPPQASEPFEMKCFLSTFTSSTILSNSKYCKGTSYNRTMEEYENGFGTVIYNSWIGFTKLFQLMDMSKKGFHLRLAAKPTNKPVCNSIYKNLKLGNASDNYRFYSSGYTDIGGNGCGDSMTGSSLNLLGRPFSTIDEDHTSFNCPARFGGGWWFADNESCSRSFLMTSDAEKGLWLDDLDGEKFDYYSLNLIHL